MIVLMYLLGVLAVVVGIGTSIALHEIGHLMPAKAFGVKCTQYMIGFGPTLWSRRRGETEYGVKAIPLGGYVRMIGMYPPKVEQELADEAGPAARSGRLAAMIEDARAEAVAEIEPGEEHRAFYRLSTPRKVVVMLGGPVMNLLIAGAIFTGLVLAMGIPARGAEVASVSRCVQPVSAGPSDTERRCTSSDAPSPAAAAGLRQGDVIVAIDGHRVDGPEDVATEVRPRAGHTLPVTVLRDGATTTLSLTPIVNRVPQVDSFGRVVRKDGAPVMVDAGFIGTSTAPRQQVDHSPARVPGMLWDMTTGTARVVLTLPQRMIDVWNAAFGPGERDANGPMSVVGVGRMAGEVASDTRVQADGSTAPAMSAGSKAALIVNLLGGLNIALFVFNLVPLLPLDGGHVAGALWEGLKRTAAKVLHRPDPGYVDVAKALPLTYGVASLLLAMSVLLIYADVVKPVRL